MAEEHATAQEGKGPRPSPMPLRELIFSVTHRCNHACAMCYYHDTLGREMRDLDLSEIEKVSASLGDIDRLWISGGEPFLRSDLPEIIAIFHRQNRLRHVFIPTNGSLGERMALAVERMLDAAPDFSLTLMFSLEGRGERHDAIHAKPGAFAQVIRSVKLLGRIRLKNLMRQRPGFGVQMNTVVTDRNLDEVLPLMEFVRREMWVDLHTFTPVRGQVLDPAHGSVDPRAFAELVDRAQASFRHYLSRESLFRRPVEESMEALNRRYRSWIRILQGGLLDTPCVAGEGIGVLEPNGDVRVCELKPVVGSVRDAGYRFADVWSSPPALAVKATVDGCSCTHGCFMSASESRGTQRRQD